VIHSSVWLSRFCIDQRYARQVKGGKGFINVEKEQYSRNDIALNFYVRSLGEKECTRNPGVFGSKK
jgi:hypothetical protein